jgi:tRNA-binding EMAP/Myf-like protein
MRVPVQWLHEYCAPDMPVGELATRLAMTGTEVDRVEHHGVGALEHFVVGRVISAQQHPDADRLTVCVVDIGGGEESQIVCGAPNVAAGQTVAVARPGSIMPDGTKLKKAKLRGQESNGMILAEDELGIGMEHAGTMVLADSLEIGIPLAGVLPISTDVLELEITPNRPDCLAVYGVAREAHAATGAPQTICDCSPPPRSTTQTFRRSASGCCCADSTRPTTKLSSSRTPWWSIRSTSVPVIASRVASSSTGMSGSQYSRSHSIGTFIRTAPGSARRCRTAAAGPARRA